MCISDEQRRVLHDIKVALSADQQLGASLSRVAPATWPTAAAGTQFSQQTFNGFIEAIINEYCPNKK
jgi:hypothetical protein